MSNQRNEPSQSWQKNWTEIFSIDTAVADHFVNSNREWVLDLMSLYLVDTHKAYSHWVIQFGEAVSLLGQQEANLAGPNLLNTIMQSGLFKSAQHYRGLLRKVYGLQFSRKPRKHLTYKMSETLTNYSVSNRFQFDEKQFIPTDIQIDLH